MPNHYLAKALFRVIRGRMRQQELSILKNTMTFDDEDPTQRQEMEQAVRSHWPVSVIKKKEDVESHILAKLVDEYASLNVEWTLMLQSFGHTPEFAHGFCTHAASRDGESWLALLHLSQNFWSASFAFDQRAARGLKCFLRTPGTRVSGMLPHHHQVTEISCVIPFRSSPSQSSISKPHSTYLPLYTLVSRCVYSVGRDPSKNKSSVWVHCPILSRNL